jgi:hypothetical protein
MRTLLLLLAASALAQEHHHEHPGMTPKVASESAPATVEDAKMNFMTVIETYVLDNTKRGFWEFHDASSGRTLKLKLVAIRQDSIREDGKLHTGLAVVRDVASGRQLQAQFKVDLASTPWTVVSADVWGSFALDPRKAYEAVVRKRAEKAPFTIQDQVTGKTWKLRLVQVHADKLVELGHDKFFACADFVELGGAKPLDLDFYATRLDKGWRIDEILIHKVAGQERFTYDKDNQRIPLGN